MKITGIYQIQSRLKPERIYIGSAVDINGRWFAHLHLLRKSKHHSIKLQNHYNKYGEADLQFSVILGCEKEDLIKTEQYFIDSYKPFFNCCLTAGSTLGKKHSKEAREKMSKALMGNTRTKGIKLRVSAKTGIRQPLSEETKKRLSESHKGNKSHLGMPCTEETKDKIRKAHIGEKNYFFGKKHSDEAKQKVSKANKNNKYSVGRILSAETKRKISESLKGRKCTHLTA